MKITILGCGTSAGVPQIGCHCPVCRSGDPRNKRRRTSIHLSVEGLSILFDTGPELREQCLDAGIERLDALIFTHAHADHVHGIDDMRQFNNLMMRPIPTYAHPSVFARIKPRFAYAFEDGRVEDGFWRPQLDERPFEGPFEIGGVRIVPFEQNHGRGRSWGFKTGRFAYSTDTDGLGEAAFEALRGTRVWVVDCLRERPHPSHAHLDLTLSWIERVGPERAYLIHMNHEVDYATWCEMLPGHVRPCHDGLVIEVD